MLDPKPIIAAQYRASLAMLGQAIDRCSDELWLAARHNPPFWRVAYHTLFFTDLYLSETVSAFVPWSGHREQLESLDPLVAVAGPPCTQADIAAYCASLSRGVAARIADYNLSGPSGMPWLPFTKLELQFYNTRHIHHHAGQLSIWLREESEREIDWVGSR